MVHIEQNTKAAPERDLTPEELGEAMEASRRDFKDGDIVEGEVVKIDRDEVLLDIGYKSEGVIPSKELSIRHDVDPNEVVKVGDRIEALVLQKEDKEGRLILSKKRAQYERAWGRIEEIMRSGMTINGPVIEVVKGGLILDIGLRGFLPASLVDLRRVRDLHPFVGQELEVKIIELDRNRNNVVLSRRAFLEESQSEGRKKFLEGLQKGERRRGTVSSIVNFGAFVDLGGVDGLVHVSELSWKHVDHPSEVVSVGQEVEVEVLDVDLERERVSLSLKATQEDPWKEFERMYQAGEIIEGQVTKLVPFGAFVRVAPGIEGLVHISELSDEHVESPEAMISAGETARVKVIDVDVSRRRISLSMRQVGGAMVQPAEREIEAEVPEPNVAEAELEPASELAPSADFAAVEEAVQSAGDIDVEPEAEREAPSSPEPEQPEAVEDVAAATSADTPEQEDVSLESILEDLKRREGRAELSVLEAVLLVGLTGGIGAGKSTVARMLADRGAVILDADVFARAAVSGRTAALDRVVERFGREVLEPSGELDRARLASIVFADESSRRDLEAIIHPEVRRMVAEGVGANAETDNVVVVVNPLLIEMGMQSNCDVVVLVSADEHTQVARSVARGMDPNDVRARIAAQLPSEEKSRFVDVVVENAGTLEDLERQVDRLWGELRRRASMR